MTADKGAPEPGAGGTEGRSMATDRSSRLAAIKARCEAATPGPWKDEYAELEGFASILRHDGTDWHQVCDADQHDRPFIAHARSDVPWLLAEIERLEAALQEIAGLPYQRSEVISGHAGAVILIARAALAGTEGGDARV